MFEKKFRVDELFVAGIREYNGNINCDNDVNYTWIIIKKLYDDHGCQYGLKILSNEVIDYCKSINQVDENLGNLMIFVDKPLQEYVSKKKISISEVRELEENLNINKSNGLRK